MKFGVLFPLAVFLPATFGAVTIRGDVTIQDTTGPNHFWLSSAEYVVSAGATSAVVRVEFMPGDRGYSGWVDISTCGGTAEAGADYVPASRRLWFNGPMTHVVEIELGASIEPGQTIEVCLHNPEAILTRDRATIRIEAPPLRLEVRAAANGFVQVSWPMEHSHCRLEGGPSPFGPWEEVSETPVIEGGRRVVRTQPQGGGAFFRLRLKD